MRNVRVNCWGMSFTKLVARGTEKLCVLWMTKVEVLSTPGGEVGRSCGGWNTERTSQNGLPGSRKQDRSEPHIYSRYGDTDAQRRDAQMSFFLICGLMSRVSQNPTACLPILVGGGESRRFRVWVQVRSCVRVGVVSGVPCTVAGQGSGGIVAMDSDGNMPSRRLTLKLADGLKILEANGQRGRDPSLSLD